MKLARTNTEGFVEIIVPVNLDKTKQLFPDAVEVLSIPDTDIFQKAWELNNNVITENLTKAKEIAHQKRRVKRDSLFAPYDKIIAAQIPNTDTAAVEQAREDIRSGDALVQQSIDSATTTAELKTIIENYEAI